LTGETPSANDVVRTLGQSLRGRRAITQAESTKTKAWTSPWVESPALSDQVTIRIPATTRHVALVRATATTLAALLDFTYDRLTDLHIAIDEICSRILATSSPRASRLEVTFTLEEGGIKLEASGDTPLKPGEEFLTTWSKAILDSVAEQMDSGVRDGITFASLRILRG
jgi:hypothetical protein